MECKHDISLLMGTKDGIVCRGCGKLFPTFTDLEADRKGESAPEITPEESAPEPEAPKTAKKSGTKGGKK